MYVLAPLAVRVVPDPPVHIVGDDGVTFNTAPVDTFTIAVAVLVHPCADVPVTV